MEANKIVCARSPNSRQESSVSISVHNNIISQSPEEIDLHFVLNNWNSDARWTCIQCDTNNIRNDSPSTRIHCSSNRIIRPSTRSTQLL